MIWDYRIGKKVLTCKVDCSNDVYEEDCYGIVEAYYNDKGEVTFTTERFVNPYGETLEELKSSFEMMKEAFDKPALDLDNIEYSNEL